MSSGRSQEVKNNGKLFNRQPQKVGTVVYMWWLFTRRSNWEALTVKILVFWMHESSPMGGGHL